MSGDTRRYALDISKDLFHLTTESLRLRANETMQYETLDSLVDSRAAATSYRDEHNPETIRKHLGAVPTNGDIRIYLSISKTSAQSLAEAKDRLGQRLGSQMTVGDALSVLLFDYVVELKAARVLDRLGLGEAGPGDDGSTASESHPANVIPIR